MKKAILVLLLFCANQLHGREPYHATVTIDATSGSVNAPNLVDFKRDLSTSALEELIPIYNPDSAVFFGINLRGIIVDAAFAANSTTLTVSIPQADINTSFTGSTRDESISLFNDSIKEGGPKHKLFKAYAKYSPLDPIAGNPDSLQARMAEADYLLSSLYPFKGCDCCWNTQPSTHYFQGGIQYGRGFSKGFETSSVSLPLRYSYSPLRTTALIIDLPMAYHRNGGASTVIGSLGLAAQIPVNERWSLTPLLRVGSGGSLDLVTGSCLVSFGLTSGYRHPVQNLIFSLNNYAGYSLSTNLWLTGVNFDYHLHHFIFKNGISITSCEGFTLCNRTVNYQIAFVDSYFSNDELYINHYDEISGAILLNYLNPRLKYDCLSLGFSYRFGQNNYKGYRLNAIYQF